MTPDARLIAAALIYAHGNSTCSVEVAARKVLELEGALGFDQETFTNKGYRWCNCDDVPFTGGHWHRRKVEDV